MLNPVHLRTLTTVIRSGSFANAARLLGYTSSAVSQQIASLERAVGMQLFERQTHSVHPTSAAMFLAERSRPVLAALGELEDDVTGLSSGQLGRLRLGSFPTASEFLLPTAMAALVESHPGVSIKLDEGEPNELLPLLQDAELDAAVVYRYDLVPHRWPRNITARHLIEEELVLLLPESHRLAGRKNVPWSELDNETWISSQENTSGYRCLTRLAAGVGIVPSVAYRSNDYDVVRSFVGAGLGIALVPALGVLPQEGVVRSHIEGVAARRRISVVWRPIGKNSSAPAAVEALERAAEQLVRAREHLRLNTAG